MRINPKCFCLVFAFFMCFSSVMATAYDDNPYVFKDRFANKKEVDEKAEINTDLIYRVAFGRAQDVKLMLEKGADPNAQNDRGLPAVYVAIIRKDSEAPRIIQTLIDHGANVNRRAASGDLPIIEAVKRGRTDVLKLLIDNKAVLDVIRDEGGYDLGTLAEKRGDKEIIAVLNDGLDAERLKIEGLKSEENFVEMTQSYAFLQCANQYLNYYMKDAPEKVDGEKFSKIIVENKADIETISKRFWQIFRVGENRLLQVKVYSRRDLINQLDKLVTNRNRELNGFGTDEDLNKRCSRIGKRWDKEAMENEGLTYEETPKVE